MSRRKTTVYMEDEDLRLLKRRAREQGVSEAFLLREAVAQYVRAPSRRPRPKSLGSLAGTGRIAARTDDLLAEGFGAHGTPRR